MTKKVKIVSAPVGYIAQHYNGKRSIIFKHRWLANLCAELFGEGWYVRDLREPLFIVVPKKGEPMSVAEARLRKLMPT